jgi:hypothetical protein
LCFPDHPQLESFLCGISGNIIHDTVVNKPTYVGIFRFLDHELKEDLQYYDGDLLLPPNEQPDLLMESEEKGKYF